MSKKSTLDLEDPPSFVDPRLNGEEDKVVASRNFRAIRRESTRHHWDSFILSQPKQAYLNTLIGSQNVVFSQVGYQFDEEKRGYSLDLGPGEDMVPHQETHWLATKFLQDVHPYTVYQRGTIVTHVVQNLSVAHFDIINENESDVWDEKEAMRHAFDSLIVQIMLTATPLLVEVNLPAETVLRGGSRTRKGLYTLYKFDPAKLNELCIRASHRVWAMSEEDDTRELRKLSDQDRFGVAYDTNAKFLYNALNFAQPINASNKSTGQNETLWYFPWVLADWVFFFPHAVSREEYRLRETTCPFRMAE